VCDSFDSFVTGIRTGGTGSKTNRLYKALVDKGLATQASASAFPFKGLNHLDYLSLFSFPLFSLTSSCPRSRSCSVRQWIIQHLRLSYKGRVGYSSKD
jgi:hypothetical protein